jgi:hypothetical protein
LYPSLGENIGFAAATQDFKGSERPVAFLSRYLTKTEKGWGELEQLISVTSWALRKLRRYSSTAPKVIIRVEREEDIYVLLDKEAHLRLRGLLVDLSLYKCEWQVGQNDWKLGERVIENKIADAPLADIEPINVPVMIHADVTIKRKTARSVEVGAADLEGHVLCQFDGGSASRLGTGGMLIWGPSGKLWYASA